MNLPKYWNGSRDGRSYEGALREDLAFDELMYVSHESLQHFQDMVARQQADVRGAAVSFGFSPFPANLVTCLLKPAPRLRLLFV